MNQPDFPVGADIEMWNAGPDNEDRKVVRPCRIRINGTEVVFIEGSAPFVHINDFGGKLPLTLDLKGLVVRSLKIHPTDPGKPVGNTRNIIVNNATTEFYRPKPRADRPEADAVQYGSEAAAKFVEGFHERLIGSQSEVRRAEAQLAKARRKFVDAFAEDAVQRGEYASKGAAKRAWGINESPSPNTAEWIDRITAGMAGARPVVNNVTVVKRPWWKFWGK